MTKKNLKKTVTFIEAISLVIGMIIGSGIFLKIGIVLQNAGSSGMALLAWITGGIITIASALTIAEIAAAIPKTGGLYIYLEELYGSVWGFLLGWVQTVISYPASGAALAIAFASFSSFFIPMNDIQLKVFAAITLIFVITINIIATKFGGAIQTISTIAKLIPIATIIIFGLIKGEVRDFSFIQSFSVQGQGFGVAILGTLWAYDGWIGVTNMAGELKNPKKDLHRSIIIGVSSVIVVYALFNFAIMKLIPIDTIANSKQPAVDAATALFGSKGGAFIAAGIMISVFGTLNGYLMTGARVPFAMAKRKQLPLWRTIGKAHSKFETPGNALILQCILALIYIFTGSFNTLTDLLVFVLWIFFVMGVAGIFVLRKRIPSEKRPYKVPLFPLIPLVGILGGVYILISTIISSPINSIIGIGITILGLPVYYFLMKKER
ncbi:amino acid permease [Clostridium sediminicola]|uniref:APC family permease n=1 Tax=Clostridium sediminicola TaxID=3114879 RepID=UPI0031F1C834